MIVGEELKDVLSSVPKADMSYAVSLISYYQCFKKLTPRQEFFARRIIEKAKAPRFERRKIALGNFNLLVSLFVATKLRSPKVHLLLDQEEIVLTMSQHGSIAPGTIDVRTAGDYASRRWYGRILRSGEFEVSPREEPPYSLVTLLHAFASDPLKVAAEYGFRTGRCCFCKRRLCCPQSVELGFGPSCGKRYGDAIRLIRPRG